MDAWLEVVAARNEADSSRRMLDEFGAAVESHEGFDCDTAMAVCLAARAVCLELRALAMLISHEGTRR